MKKLLCIIGILHSILFYSQSSNPAFVTDSIVYYGLDFSNCRLIGDFGTGDGNLMRTKMFVDWNSLVAREQEKFDFKGMFHKSKVYYDLNPVAIQNSKTNDAFILTPNPGYTIQPATIQSMVSSYELGDKADGIGLVFIVESFDKTKKLAAVYVTFFDIASKKVLISEKMYGIPLGIGLRNYWANSIYDIMKYIREKHKFSNY